MLVHLRVVADPITALVDELLEHLLFLAEQELEPEALALGDDFDFELLVDLFVLLLNELLEVVGLVVELDLPSDGVEELPELVDEFQQDAHDDEVEERQLDHKQREVDDD